MEEAKILSQETIEKKLLDLENKKIEIIDKAYLSGDPDQIIKASAYMQKTGTKTGLQIKSMLIDPMDFASSFGYKDKPTMLTYGMLRKMSRTPFTAMTINTRVAQLMKFCIPQEDEFSMGFKIKLRDKEAKPTRADRKMFDNLTEFMLDGGYGGYKWGRDDLENFVGKIVRDSLIFDQYTFEILENRKGIPQEFIATDASTYRIAMPEEGQADLRPDPLTGQKVMPFYVQMYQGSVEHEFYPWELCFGVRRPRTDLSLGGYGYAELEELVKIVTSMLHSDEYNSRFFSQGSAPKGIIRISGSNISETSLNNFKRQWQAQMAGVYNSWKTPVMEADKMEWVDINKTNRDMEYSRWQEYLIKLHSAIYLIDPSELGFDISKGQNQKVMFESNNSNRVKYSRDKGLVPILRNVAKSFNRHLIWRIDPRYEFCFVGVDSLTEDEAVDRAIKKLGNYKQVDEIRAEFDEKPLGEELGGHLILNSSWISWYNNKMIAEQQNQGQGQEEGMSEDDFGQEEQQYDPLDDYEGDGDIEQSTKDSLNPFVKDLENFLGSL